MLIELNLKMYVPNSDKNSGGKWERGCADTLVSVRQRNVYRMIDELQKDRTQCLLFVGGSQRC